MARPLSTGYGALAMTSTLVDTNVLVDVFGTGSEEQIWSSNALRRLSETTGFVLSPVVWAELSFATSRSAELADLVDWLKPRREVFDFAMAKRAGIAHAHYRRAGGSRERTLPDFMIGAHAEVAGHRLLTRDPARYRAYFPTVDIIAPDTHP